MSENVKSTINDQFFQYFDLKILLNQKNDKNMKQKTIVSNWSNVKNQKREIKGLDNFILLTAGIKQF